MTATLETTVVADVMLRRVKTLSADATASSVRRMFASERVHLVVVLDGSRVVTSITRDDLDRPGDGAADLGTLVGRTVAPDASLDAVHRHMLEAGLRRLVVVDEAGRFHGLLCLKSHGRGFCSDDDVRCGQAERASALITTSES